MMINRTGSDDDDIRAEGFTGYLLLHSMKEMKNYEDEIC